MRELVTILKRFEGSRVKRNGSVWRLDGSSNSVQECKTFLLDAICSKSQPFVCYDEPPVEFAQLREAIEVAPNTWHLPLGAPGPMVLSWLYMGNWQLYVADAPIETIPDLCRSPNVEISQFIVETGVPLFIDSFHDDEYWVVGLRDIGNP